MQNKMLFTIIFVITSVISIIWALNGSLYYILVAVINIGALLTSILYPKKVFVVPMLISVVAMIFSLVILCLQFFA